MVDPPSCDPTFFNFKKLKVTSGKQQFMSPPEEASHGSPLPWNHSPISFWGNKNQNSPSSKSSIASVPSLLVLPPLTQTPEKETDKERLEAPESKIPSSSLKFFYPLITPTQTPLNSFAFLLLTVCSPSGPEVSKPLTFYCSTHT